MNFMFSGSNLVVGNQFSSKLKKIIINFRRNRVNIKLFYGISRSVCIDSLISSSVNGSQWAIVINIMINIKVLMFHQFSLPTIAIIH